MVVLPPIVSFVEVKCRPDDELPTVDRNSSVIFSDRNAMIMSILWTRLTLLRTAVLCFTSIQFCIFIYICLRSFPLITIIFRSNVAHARHTATLRAERRDAFAIRKFFSRAIYVQDPVSRRFISFLFFFQSMKWAKRREHNENIKKNNQHKSVAADRIFYLRWVLLSRLFMCSIVFYAVVVRSVFTSHSIQLLSIFTSWSVRGGSGAEVWR